MVSAIISIIIILIKFDSHPLRSHCNINVFKIAGVGIFCNLSSSWATSFFLSASSNEPVFS